MASLAAAGTAAAPLCRGGTGRRDAYLSRHGATLDQVIKCTVMLADMKEWRRKHLPARSAFGTTGPALGARLKLGCMAVLPKSG